MINQKYNPKTEKQSNFDVMKITSKLAQQTCSSGQLCKQGQRNASARDYTQMCEPTIKHYVMLKRHLLKAVFWIWQFKFKNMALHISNLHSKLWKILEKERNSRHLLLSTEHLNISTHECIAPTIAHVRLLANSKSELAEHQHSSDVQ